ncbi:MAG: radical SAM protein [Thermoplasmatota archaeon]
MRNDARHPSLGRALPVAQRRLDAANTPRLQYGITHVQEVHVKTALQDFTGMPVPEPTWSLNPYLGCAHRCTYCYVPDTLQAERHRWGRYVILKRNLPTVLARELATKTPGRVYLSTATDPYQPTEAEHRITRACLDRIARRQWPLDVLTRSPLVLRDLDLLVDIDARVGLSVPTLDDGLRAILEPAAPPIDARLDTLHRLADAGLTTYANLAPLQPPSNGYTAQDVAQTFAELNVAWVNAAHWIRLPTVLPVVAAHARDTPYADLPRIVQNKQAMVQVEQDLQDAFDAIGLPLHRGFFNPPAPPP